MVICISGALGRTMYLYPKMDHGYISLKLSSKRHCRPYFTDNSFTIHTENNRHKLLKEHGIQVYSSVTKMVKARNNTVNSSRPSPNSDWWHASPLCRFVPLALERCQYHETTLGTRVVYDSIKIHVRNGLAGYRVVQLALKEIGDEKYCSFIVEQKLQRGYRLILKTERASTVVVDYDLQADEYGIAIWGENICDGATIIASYLEKMDSNKAGISIMAPHKGMMEKIEETLRRLREAYKCENKESIDDVLADIWDVYCDIEDDAQFRSYQGSSIARRRNATEQEVLDNIDALVERETLKIITYESDWQGYKIVVHGQTTTLDIFYDSIANSATMLKYNAEKNSITSREIAKLRTMQPKYADDYCVLGISAFHFGVKVMPSNNIKICVLHERKTDLDYFLRKGTEAVYENVQNAMDETTALITKALKGLDTHPSVQRIREGHNVNFSLAFHFNSIGSGYTCLDKDEVYEALGKGIHHAQQHGMSCAVSSFMTAYRERSSAPKINEEREFYPTTRREEEATQSEKIQERPMTPGDIAWMQRMAKT